MNIITPNVELWKQGDTIEDIWKHIAKCVRVCYQSTPKGVDESEEAFVKRVLFRDDEHWNSVRNHTSMLEHGTIYLYIKYNDFIYVEDEYEIISFYKQNKYSKCKSIIVNDNTDYCITTNLRVIIENYREHDLQYLCTPTTYHARRYTFCFTTNIGVSREFNRHRVNSIAEESTRYCNYTKDKFGNEVTFVLPAWYDKMSSTQQKSYKEMLQEAEDNYMILLDKWDNKKPDRRFKTGFKDNPLTPQQAREVLPLATKTQLVHTAFEDDWKHFIALRSDGVSGKPHPNAKELADKVKEILKECL